MPELDRGGGPYEIGSQNTPYKIGLIVESVARVSQHVLFTHHLLESDCFNCKGGVLLRLFTSVFTKQNNYKPRFCNKKVTHLWGIFNNYKEKLSVPRVHTAALIES